MSEDPDREDNRTTDSEEVPQTGIAALDDAIRAVASLDGDRVEEHVSTFESAHVVLRRSLDQPRTSS